MLVFGIDIDLQTVPINVTYPTGDVRNDIARGRRMNFRSVEIQAIPAPGEIFQFAPPLNGRGLVCLAVHHDGVPAGHDAIVVYQLHR